nr:PREDICTED: tubulin polyglutamylase complex subunit 2-like [Latimeria chalumnae]|eukprot:XP_005990499.1 PREDICTED: tubulin polyglutamylase complex subunit 2-like [Latimeria chalumnae]
MCRRQQKLLSQNLSSALLLRARNKIAEEAEIWFLDRALYWHFFASTFTAYYRLMVIHLGLPQWQYTFTKYGVSPQAKQWFNIFKPLTLKMDLLTVDMDFVNKLDPNKAFKTKVKTPVTKKKLPPPPTGAHKGHTGPASGRNLSRK